MQKKKGISLIVLVITIIVMIILAAAIILSLNNAGIIGNANKAVSETDYKNVQTAAQLIYADMMLSETEKPSMMLKQGEYIKQKLISQGTITADQAAMYRFKNNGEVVKLQTKSEYEAMYKDELAMLDSTYYTVSETGVFSLNNVDGLKSLTTLAIPYGVTKIQISNVSGYKLTNLTNLIMPDTVLELEAYTLESAEKLETIIFSKKIDSIKAYLPANWKNNNRKDGLVIVNDILVSANVNTKNIIIPDGVEVIGMYVFSHYFEIISVTIPDTVEYIDEGAFSVACGAGVDKKLKEIQFEGEIPEMGDFAFGSRKGIPIEMQNVIVEKNEIAFADFNCRY